MNIRTQLILSNIKAATCVTCRYTYIVHSPFELFLQDVFFSEFVAILWGHLDLFFFFFPSYKDEQLSLCPGGGQWNAKFAFKRKKIWRLFSFSQYVFQEHVFNTCFINCGWHSRIISSKKSLGFCPWVSSTGPIKGQKYSQNGLAS